MEHEITIKVNKEVYEKFYMALKLNEENHEVVIEKGMKQYIAKTFAETSKHFANDIRHKSKYASTKSDKGMANRRIPGWALKPQQYNHKIIRAYFKVEDLMGKVKLHNLEHMCSQEDKSDLYVPTFKSNYAQMKIDGPKTHGKVFEDDGQEVKIWDEVKGTLMHYKQYFVE